jgi:dolichol-phosphate mannosyltransferase
LLVWPLTKVSDPMSGCFAVRKSFYHQHKAKFCAVGYKILLEILVKSRCQTTLELPLSFRSRKEGSSKVNIKIMLESIYHICNLYKFGVLSKKD